MPAPENPYRVGNTMDGPAASPYHREATGLQGEMLDAMLKAAFTEGAQVGHREGYATARQRWAECFDQGYDKGVEGGRIETIKRARPRLVEIEKALAEAHDQTKATASRDAISAALAEVMELQDGN